ncbi:hypothetical protein YC2023_016357 [Brassica napus]
MKGRGQVIVVLKMWRVWKFLSYFGPPGLWLETEGGLSDFRFNPRLPEVEEFRQSLLRNDPYVQRYGAHSNLVVQLLYLIGESFINPFEDVVVVLKLQRIKHTPIIPTIWVLIDFGDELGDAHPAPTLTRYSRSSYSSPTTGRGRRSGHLHYFSLGVGGSSNGREIN